jgi:hypothetical protein
MDSGATGGTILRGKGVHRVAGSPLVETSSIRGGGGGSGRSEWLGLQWAFTEADTVLRDTGAYVYQPGGEGRLWVYG